MKNIPLLANMKQSAKADLRKPTSSKLNPRKLMLASVLMPMIMGLSACQSNPTSPVMQRADATFETTGLGESKVEAQKKALLSAKDTCGRKQPIILTNNVVYNGVLDEQTGRMVDQVGAVAGALFGKVLPGLARADDYEYSISFRCQ